ncbi:MAG TPA: DUF4349 domain-containing protein [Solirubrobacteraceae bacterium]
MRIVHFPTAHDDDGAEQAWLQQLESALDGDAQGPAAESWRELRDDVRSLAPAMSADFERELSERILERDRARVPRKLRLTRPSRPAIATAFSVAVVALVALVAVAPWRGGHAPEAEPAQHVSSGALVRAPSATATPTPTPKGSAQAAGEASPAGAAVAPSSNGPAAALGRIQQLGASVTLAVTPANVQETSNRVSRLVVRDGGFVQSSHVQVQQGRGGEATLTLRLPSEKLSAALASLEQIAPVREESQSLQDITNTYDAARQRLRDVEAERQALLRALAKATTEGEIDSLRERLAQSRGALAGAHSALEVVSRRASTAEVEVTVLGDAHAAGEGLTLHRGLHDAGRVLTVTLVVLLIAAAALVPLALLLLGLTAAVRVWRRRRREQVLGTS